MSEIIFYTIDCPHCKILEKKLIAKGISYKTVTDKDEMSKLGISSAPVLSVDGKLLPYPKANDWVNAY